MWTNSICFGAKLLRLGRLPTKGFPFAIGACGRTGSVGKPP